MKRHEIAAIVGAYSRDGFSSYPTTGGFFVERIGFRTTREARLDTGVDLARKARETYRQALNFDLR